MTAALRLTLTLAACGVSVTGLLILIVLLGRTHR